MDLNYLALGKAVIPSKASTGPWDWEKAYEMPNFGIVGTLSAIASWLAAKFTQPTVPALRAAHA
jgi:hypothetical protein